MLTTIILAAMLSAQPSPEAKTVLYKAEADARIAAELVSTCWTPAECVAARKLSDAAEASLSAARTLIGAAAVAGEPDPFAPDVQPFVDMTVIDVAAMIDEGIVAAEISKADMVLEAIMKP